jgi:hypothetical protein
MSLGKFSQGFYSIKNPEKYIGTNKPYYRSSWELTFCMFCDNNPAVNQWASESVKIPYRDPLTGKQTVYVPDFFVLYMDKNNNKHAELIEIKPEKHTILEKVGKNPYNQAQFVRNQAKWAAANNWCKNQGIRFRIISEGDIYHTGGKRNK